MQETNYQFEDFLMAISEEHKDFALTVNEKLLQEGCKVKIGSSKTNLFSVKYIQGRKGVLNFTLRKKGLTVSIYARSFEQYSDVLNGLHARVIDQIVKAPDCKNLIGPKKCSWAECIGYSIPIGDDLHQKCMYQCFQFSIDIESIPSLLELLESELKARQAA